MPEIAPWENPDLPAPFATIEREIEGRVRHFALWRWENRIVWRDLRFRQLWWATLDVAASVADWKRAIDAGEFGRAISETCCFGGRGAIVGFDQSVSFSSTHPGCYEFYVLVGADGSGIACWKQHARWWKFESNDYKRLRRQLRRNHSKFNGESPILIPIWQSHFQPPHLKNALLDGFKPVFLRPLFPEITKFLQLGQRAELFGTVKEISDMAFAFLFSSDSSASRIYPRNQ